MGDEREKREHDEALSLLEAEIGMHEVLIEDEKLRLTEWGAEEKRKEREKIINELKSAIRLIQQKPGVTEEWIEEKAKGMKQLFINCDELPMRFFGNMPIQLMRILKEAGVEVKK